MENIGENINKDIDKLDIVGAVEFPSGTVEPWEEHVYVLAADGSPESEAAAGWLGDACRRDSAARVVVVYAFDPVTYLADYRSAGERAWTALPPLDVAMRREGDEAFAVALAALALDPARVRTQVVVGRPDIQLKAAAEREAACAIVVGRRASWGWRRLVRPALAERLLRCATCPVIAIAPPAAA